MPEYDLAEIDGRTRARIVKSAVSPRPIAWISTTSESGVDNLAPFSSYNYVSSEQPVVLFNSPDEDHGGLKDTARNALETGEFAVNVVTEALLAPMDLTSERLHSTESEFESADVERAPCRKIEPPRVAAAPITMECILYNSISIHDKVMILGEVVYFHVDEQLLVNGEVNMQKIDTVGRLGGPYYTVSDPIPFERQF